MKYIEELQHGDHFEIHEEFYLLTCEHKKNNDRLAYNLQTGNPRWFSPNEMVTILCLMSTDKDNNLFKIKEQNDDNISPPINIIRN